MHIAFGSRDLWNSRNVTVFVTERAPFIDDGILLFSNSNVKLLNQNSYNPFSTNAFLSCCLDFHSPSCQH